MDEKTTRQLRMLGGDLCALWVEAASVVWLRSSRLAKGGPEAVAEAGLMVGEKIAAQQELIGRLATGKLGKTPIAIAASATRYVVKASALTGSGFRGVEAEASIGTRVTGRGELHGIRQSGPRG